MLKIGQRYFQKLFSKKVLNTLIYLIKNKTYINLLLEFLNQSFKYEAKNYIKINYELNLNLFKQELQSHIDAKYANFVQHIRAIINIFIQVILPNIIAYLNRTFKNEQNEINLLNWYK